MSIPDISQIPFIAYPKIAESVQDWQLSPAESKRLGGVQFAVTEKIHGANLCLLVAPQAQDRTGIFAAKRKELLPDDENFFGHREIIERYAPNLLAAAQHLRSLYQELSSWVLFYGEIYGGFYPHPHVPAAVPPSGYLRMQPVQTGVCYGPSIYFSVFDMSLQSGFADFADTVESCQKSGLPVAEVLQLSSYQDALQYPLPFRSKIPMRLGLPILDEKQEKQFLGGPNWAEGVVVKPWRHRQLSQKSAALSADIHTNNDENPEIFYPIVKCKIAQFAEDRRYHGAQKWERDPTYQHNQQDPLAGQAPLDLAEWHLSGLLNVNRINSALSKSGALSQIWPHEEKRQKLCQLIWGDIKTDFDKEHSTLWQKLSTDEQMMLQEMLHSDMQALLLQIYQKNDVNLP